MVETKAYKVFHDYDSVNRAFTKQSLNYDRDDQQNQVLQDMREQVYNHVKKNLKPGDSILELNAGTGIDASYFARQGHSVLATDVSNGMIQQIREKIRSNDYNGRLTCQQLSYEDLDLLAGKKFDYVFSNFGGLNCVDALHKVTQHLPAILNPGARVTFVVMPPVCLWEWLWLFTGNGRHAFRRFKKGGVISHLEGEHFKTYYFSLPQIQKAFGETFLLLRTEGLAVLSPPPARGDFPVRYQKLYKFMRNMDSSIRNLFPFNRWGDHIVVTFQKKSAG